jgi:hypothetical protein
VLKDTALDASGAMKSTDGKPVSVGITEHPSDLFDLPGMSAAQMAHLVTLMVYVDMTADAGVGKWVEYAAKVATAFKGDDDVAWLKTMTGDTLTVDGAAKKATLKTADGVFPVAVEAPEAGTEGGDSDGGAAVAEGGAGSSDGFRRRRLRRSGFSSNFLSTDGGFSVFYGGHNAGTGRMRA